MYFGPLPKEKRRPVPERRFQFAQLVALDKCPVTVPKMVCSSDPSRVRAAIAATDTNAAIRPYSIMVAPASSLRNDLMNFTDFLPNSVDLNGSKTAKQNYTLDVFVLSLRISF